LKTWLVGPVLMRIWSGNFKRYKRLALLRGKRALSTGTWWIWLCNSRSVGSRSD
jgi:hypothetical protein